MASISTSDFTNELARLEKEFMIAGKRFSTEKAQIFYHEFRFCNLRHVQSAVNYMIGNLRYSPTLEDFKKAIDATKSGEETDGARFKTECRWCAGKGKVACIDMSKSGTPHFPYNSICQVTLICDCECEAAKLLGKNYQRIQDAVASRYKKFDYNRDSYHSL